MSNAFTVMFLIAIIVAVALMTSICIAGTVFLLEETGMLDIFREIIKRIGSDFMKIIKQGDLNIARKPLRFECKNCGTVFEAIKQEYIYCGDQRKGDNWKCECPLCHGAVYYN